MTKKHTSLRRELDGLATDIVREAKHRNFTRNKTETAIADLEAATLTVATQAEQEAASSATAAVTPSVQHSHPSAWKFWAAVGVSGGTPSIASSYNVTSITDTGVGRLTVTIATDFSGVGWFETLAIAETAFVPLFWIFSKAAGSTEVRCADTASTLTDPAAYFVGGAGDQ